MIRSMGPLMVVAASFLGGEDSRDWRPRWPVSTGSRCIFAGLLAIVVFSPLYYVQNKSKSWPTTEGVVTKSAVLHSAEKDTLNFSYTYSVEQRRFTSSRVNNALINRFGGLDPQQAASTYSVGRKVIVYYDPENPGDALLEPGASSQTIWGIVFGVVAFLLGIWLYFTRSFKEMDAQERWDEKYRGL
jgi:hypothetical protein